MSVAPEFQQVSHDLFFWQAYDPSVKVDLSSCAIRTNEGLVLIDPIPLARQALSELREIAAPAAIILTNGNHTRDAASYRDRFSIPILAHADAVPELGISIDREVNDGDVIHGDLTIVTTPGAGPGEIAVHSGRNSLHLGDAVIHMESTGLALLPEKYCTDAKRLGRELEKLLRFEFTVLTFAHGLPITVQAKPRFAQLLA